MRSSGCAGRAARSERSAFSRFLHLSRASIGRTGGWPPHRLPTVFGGAAVTACACALPALTDEGRGGSGDLEHPVAGDKVYGGRQEGKFKVQSSRFRVRAERQMLHAWRVGLPPEDRQLHGVRGSATGRLDELASFGAVSDATEDGRFLKPSIRSCPTEGRSLAPPTARWSAGLRTPSERPRLPQLSSAGTIPALSPLANGAPTPCPATRSAFRHALPPIPSPVGANT
jgi:hypothetical protein